jgi:tyrosine-protein kinase Etk/Wzc
MAKADDRNLLDYIFVLVKWRRLVVVGTLAAAIAVAGVSLLLPERWTARTSLLPPDEESGGLGVSLLGGNGASGIPAGLAGLIGASTPAERLLTLLDSRRLLGLAVDRHGLIDEYDALHRDQAIDLLALKIERELGDDGSVAIEVTASTPQLAADLTNTVASLLDSLNREYRQRQASSTLTFLEGRLRSTRADLSQDAGRLRDFQKMHGIVDIKAQTAAAVDVVKGIVLELSLLQVELGVVSQQLTPEHPERQLLELKVGELQNRLQLLVGELSSEIGDNATGAGALGPPLQALPDVMHEYAGLTMQLEVKEQILAFLGAKAEEAKYSEARNTPTLQVLDRATPPHIRSFPRRLILTIAGAGTALVLLTLLAFVLEAWQRGALEQQDQLAAIRGAWRR